MNRYIRGCGCFAISLLKSIPLEMSRKRTVNFPIISFISPRTEITVDKDAQLRIGSCFKMRSGSKIRVRKSASVDIGTGFSMSNNCFIVAHEKISIGNNVQFGPGVLVYDHDHDYAVPDGMKAEKYKTSPIIIGDNVWVGANTIILRGTEIGDNTVIAAGSVLKGVIPPNVLAYQKRETVCKEIHLMET